MQNISTDQLLYFGVIIALAWAAARWGHIVAKKVPDWMALDWTYQAETFLAEKDTVMDPLATPVPTTVTAQAPSYAWWTPKSPNSQKHTHRLWWLPVLGPWLENDKRGAWSELWVPFLLIATVVVAGMAVAMNPAEGFSVWRIIGAIILFAWLQALSTVDHKTHYLPDMMTIPLLWLGLAMSVQYQGLTSPAHAVEGAITGYGTLWLISTAFKMIRKKEGMGAGDFKLMGALGAWLGVNSVFIVIGLASILGLCYAIYFAIQRKGFGQFAFGPSLATSAIIVYIFQPVIIAQLKLMM